MHSRQHSRFALSAPLFAAGAVSLALHACAYDFDHFAARHAGEAGGASGSGGSSERGGTSAERGGTTSGGADAGSAGAANDAGTTSTEGGADGGGENAGGASGGAASAGGTTATGGATAAGGSVTMNGGSGSGGAAGFDCDARGGKLANAHCYFPIGRDAPLSWQAAKSACESADAHLVTLTSAAEAQLVVEQFLSAAGDHWIGLALANTSSEPPRSCKNNPASCPFRWVTAEPLEFSDWAMHSALDKEPNYTGACVRIQAADLKWADNGCSQELPAICEHE